MTSFQTVLIPAKDLAAARELYTKLLGTAPSADSDYYVGYDVDGQQRPAEGRQSDTDAGSAMRNESPTQHIGLVPGDGEVTAYLHVDDLDGTIEQITAAGGEVVEEPKSVGGTRRVAVVTDPSGGRIGLLSDAG
ncbi:VOC family protein [Flexivirga sp. ID2601S]|uniref:VOC family protein n=1 Tax=Flexivirga aerilata TaxID=1656889 RepID=A0A849AFG6_9MICO|nr:VOC family protein [Flexivirga aerilata]NNG37981.1 VOC family protein [Flexivirga aerilata]